MQDIRDFRKGELTLGISTSRGAVMLPKILPEFRSAFPQIKLNLVEGTTKEINQALFEGRADLCIGFAINEQMRQKGKELGADEQLSKPEIGHLITVMDELLARFKKQYSQQ